ncbi:RHS repeat-associated core domain-containing protein [Undibacterium sp. RTI2.2]|nr:RHS repeat-associated core domain-containing protein [Undibacterium sp. RTI2.2]MEB0256108.1 RHS repeat-associated core domain-containing protein [Undibacterium sp. 5I1]
MSSRLSISLILTLSLALGGISQVLAETTSSGAVGKGIIHTNDVGAETVIYVHTDGLGSPVAKTDQNGTRLTQTKYEAYGMTVAGSDVPTIGFTGHVNDADTGLTYMQQRYYDPVAARFLSEDPVLTDANTGSGFNRYVYANNNPYKFVDPDGRNPWALRLAYAAGYETATALGAPILGGLIATVIWDVVHSDVFKSEPKKNDASDAPKTGDKSDTKADVGISSSLPKPPTGPGSVPNDERDPKRFFTPGEREAKRGEQGNKCGNGCGTDIDQSNSTGHHEIRHADGGPTTPENHVEVCKVCHTELHNGK